MRTTKLRLFALLLSFCLLLTGCGLPMRIISQVFHDVMYDLGYPTAFADMEYTRPDMDTFNRVLEAACETANTADDPDTVMEAVYDFYWEYDSFFTNYALADIHYSSDLTDAFWEQEYTFCSENEPAAQAALDNLYYALAACPLREALDAEAYFGPDFLAAYDSEPWMDAQLLEMMEQEAVLQNRYYELSDLYSANEYTLSQELYTQMAELLAELVSLRQQMAAYLGYGSYCDLAYELYFYRQYTPEQAVEYMLQIRDVLYESYVQLLDSSFWEDAYAYCSEAETFRYLKQATGAMGGVLEEAFDVMDVSGLYDIWYGENKFDSSFSTYLWTYSAPFLFMNPYLDQSDKLTISHEFGHFAADYVCGGTYAGTDVMEVHSQGLEYLTLCYGEDIRQLTRYKLADSLCTYMEQSAYSLFEHTLYSLPPEELTPEKLSDLYQQVGTQFGLDTANWDPRDFVTIPHLYIEPVYMISYVVSNDLALQFYQLELASPGEGLALYEQSLSSQESYLLTFAEDLGLESPFSRERLQAVARLFAESDL